MKKQSTSMCMQWKWCAISTLVIALLFSVTTVFAQNQTIGTGLEGQALINFIQQNYTPNQTMGYNVARDIMYSEIDNTNGKVSGVYTGYTITLNPNNDPSTDAYNKGINAEHTWPQSKGASNEPARSDLHNLFPAKSNVNSARNNDPLGEVNDNLTDTWYYLDQSQSSVPTSNIDLYAENYGSTAFEPREQHKGNAARAVFYFVAIYQNEADPSFFNLQKNDLYQWHYADPVDAAELKRSQDISAYQGNENPFILDSSLVRRAFFPDGNTGGSDTTPPAISSVQAANIGANSATISWSTNEMATSQVDYGTTTSYGFIETNNSLTTSHSITLTGLTANSTYNFRVSSTDGSSNTATSTNYSFTTTNTGSSSGTIVFSEIFYDTPGTDSNEEWIELYNNSASTIDLGGYTIVDNNGSGSSYTIPNGTTIIAGSYLTIATNASGFNAIYGYDADLYGSIPALNNGGDALILKDNQLNQIDAVAWEGGASAGTPPGWGGAGNPVAATGETIYRSIVTSDSDSFSDWAVAANNGEPQTQALVPTVNYILFSEIFYDTPGTDSDEEWVELYNPTSQQIDISGYAIVDNNGTGASYTFPTGTIIEGNSYFTIASNQAGFNALYAADAYQYGNLPALNNSGDALLLLDNSSTVIDQVAWEGGASAGSPTNWGAGPTAATGESIARIALDADGNTSADWSINTNNGDPATILQLDTTAPLISSVASSGISETEATITWTTNEPASSQVNYGTSTSFGSSAGSATYAVSHSITLSGLSAGTDYFYQVVSIDEAGNSATAQTYSFTTNNPPAANLPDILITEIFYDTPGTESKEEWVEIYNTTSQTINLSGWQLIDDNGNGRTFTFANNHNIAAHTYMTIASNRKAFKKLYGKNADDYVSLPALNNGGDVLVIKNPSGVIIDYVAWEGGANSMPTGWGSSTNPMAGEGNSIQRNNIGSDSDTYNDWTTSTDLGSPMTQSDGAFMAKTASSLVEEPVTEAVPTEISLSNYPNPFNPTMQIAYTLPETQHISIAVYNMLGQKVANLVDGVIEAGSHTVRFDASNFSSGIYLYTITTSSTAITNKMMLIK